MPQLGSSVEPTPAIQEEVRMGWAQPRQNSIEALVHGISHFDGVEFDLRLSSDDELILRHDNTTPNGDYVELLSADELSPFSDRFENLLANNQFASIWQEKGKTVCIELKSPHPSSGVGGGWKAGRGRVKYVARMIELVEQNLSDFDLPDGTTVIYSFDRRFLIAAKKGGCHFPRARLMPNLREWGSSKVQKTIAAPSFIANSLPRLMRMHQRWGAPMIPCALEYLVGWKKMVTIGSSVGLNGRRLEKLTRTRKGFPAFVWPVRLTHEKAILDAGLTAITDDASPDITHLPDGSPRNPRPASNPMLAGEYIPWSEMSKSQRREFLSSQRSRWQWNRSIDELLESSAENQIPWEVPRIIGHRGAGKSPQL